MSRVTNRAPAALAAVHAPMEVADVPDVVALLRAAPDTGYCDWEDWLLRRHLSDAGDLCLVARSPAGEVIGALVAGSLGVRGIVNHVAVSPPYRRRGVARGLVNAALEAFRRRGIRRVFLFVVDGNEAALALWAGVGFRETVGERTLECDL